MDDDAFMSIGLKELPTTGFRSRYKNLIYFLFKMYGITSF